MNDYISRADAIEAVRGLSALVDDKDFSYFEDALKALPSADAEPKMTEEVREALMRLTMCAREECDICKHKDKCGFEFQYNIATENMHTILEALSADAVQGEWVCKEREYNDCDGYYAHYWYECSVCGARPPKDTWKNEWHSDYCPSCGARMENKK